MQIRTLENNRKKSRGRRGETALIVGAIVAAGKNRKRRGVNEWSMRGLRMDCYMERKK